MATGVTGGARTGLGARLLAIARLYRPLNLLAIGFAALVGARLAQAPLDHAGLLVPVLIGAYGYARNDAVDVAADRANRPDRPVPSGAVGARGAGRLAYAPLLVAAILLAACDPKPLPVAVAAGAVLLLTAYSPWLKARGPWGPAAIALLTALAVLWGALGGGEPARALLPALLAATVQFARECVKDLEDLPGDRAAGRTTWPVRTGGARVRRAARVAILGALFLLPLPATAGGVGERYLYAALPLAGVPLGLSFWWLRREGARYGVVSTALKAALLGGLCALAVAA